MRVPPQERCTMIDVAEAITQGSAMSDKIEADKAPTLHNNLAEQRLGTFRLKGFFKTLGPGLITGAADDDPSGIATYSQAGAQFGVNMLWTVVLTYPLMTAIQSICARIGRVTGKGLAANMTRIFPRWAVGIMVALLFVANTVNIGADIDRIGDE
eukprot:gene33728-45171_t